MLIKGANLAYRMATFRKCRWEGMDIGRVREMTEAGLLYQEEEDIMICYFCGVALLVASGEDPCIKHAQERPLCGFLWQNKGPRYIKSALELCEKLNEQFEAQLLKYNDVFEAIPLRAMPVQAEEPSWSKFMCSHHCQSLLNNCCFCVISLSDGQEIMMGHLYCPSCCANCPRGDSTDVIQVKYARYSDVQPFD